MRLSLPQILVPVRKFLRYTDTRFSLACRVYEKFSDLQKAIEKTVPQHGLEQDDIDTISTCITKRWNDVHAAVHAAGYVLDPDNRTVDCKANKEIWDGFLLIMRRLLPSQAEVQVALQEYAGYKGGDGFSPEELDMAQKVAPLKFWECYCGHLPVLKSVAVRILDLRAGTRCVESHFSVMGAVHSKGRNRLVNGKVKKLTYIVSNTKMLDEVAKPEFAQKEEKAGESSDSDYCSDTDQEEDMDKLEAAAAAEMEED